MQQDYTVFKKNTSPKTISQYYQECIEQVKVHIVITVKRKYARIDYDFITLDNVDQKVKDFSKCKIAEKIVKYATNYMEAKQLPRNKAARVIADSCGGFEFFIEDVKLVGDDISKIIDDIVKSGCIEYTKIEDFYPELITEINKIFGK